MSACATEEAPRRGSGVAPTGGPGGSSHAGGGGPATGECEGTEIQGCKVQIDETNCFVGEQQCQDGEWGPCVDPEKLETAALGTQGDCTNNPCNPWCQTYGEDPAPDLQASGTPAPAGGPISGLPSSWQSAGQTEPCVDASDCQFDTYCHASGECRPWAFGAFDATGGPDLTVPVACNPDELYVCNRGDMVASAPIEVAILDASPTHLAGADCTDPGGTVHDTCVHNTDIAPGQCALVTGCSWSGTKTIYVNPPDPPGTDGTPPITETALLPNGCANNWSVYHAVSQCACSQTSTSSTLADVNMFIMLDSSGSMANDKNDLWTPAVNALSAFFASPAAGELNVALRTFGDNPVAGCTQGQCADDVNDGTTISFDACAVPVLGPQKLNTGGHAANLTSFLTGINDPNDVDGRTPHFAAIAGATQWATNYSIANPGGLEVVVYISDGDSSGSCIYDGSNEATVAAPAAAAFAAQGVLTYAVALPSSSIDLMNEIASQGGTTQAINLQMSGDVATDLTAKLTEIQQSLLSCDITIPNAGQVDPANMTVTYMLNGVTPTPLNPVTGAGMCSGSAPPYEYYVSAADTITMCQETCDAIRADPMADVTFLGGCIGGYTQFQDEQMYQGNCSSFPTSGPLWEFMTYDTDTPGDSEVIFEARTGNSAAEAMAGTYVEIARTSSSAQDASFGNMTEVDLPAILGPLAQQEFMQIRVTINPTSNQQATPTLFDWDLFFGCYSNE